MARSRWFSETVTPGLRLSFQAKRVLRHERTDRQELALFEHDLFGRVLLLDGAVQLTSLDEFVYHEMMAHVPILSHGSVRDVLIIGGGDGGLAEEVLKHASVRSLTQVEIDPHVVDLAREYFADINEAAFSDSRFKLIIGDGAVFVGESSVKFDLILVDSTDPVGPGRVLFTEPFYAEVRARLKPGGILVTQNGVPFLQCAEFQAAMANLAAVFARVTCYTVSVPAYFGGELALGFSSDDACVPPLDVLMDRFRRADLTTRYYTPVLHQAAFALPRYIDDSLRKAVGDSQVG